MKLREMIRAELYEAKIELKHGDRVKVSYGIINGVATVNWVDHKENFIWLSDVKYRAVKGHKKSFTPSLNPVPAQWVTKIK